MIPKESACVSNPALTARSAFAGAKAPGGSSVTLDVIDDLMITHISVLKGQTAALLSKMREAYGLELPVSPTMTEGRSLSALWAGPGQWLVIAPAEGRSDLEQELAKALTGLAAVTDQTDSRAIVRVSGPKAASVLATGLPIDLHPRAFGPNSVAITHAAHIGVVVWRGAADQSFHVACSRSFAGSFWDWLSHAAQGA
jgi:methylglutamate dehydrogenase subunit D